MDRKTALIKKLEDVKKNASKDIRIDRLIIFGSQVSGKPHKDSDIDLIVVSQDFRNLNFFQRGALMYRHWHLRLPVDFLCYTPEEFNRLRKQASMVKEAVDNGIAI